MEAEVWFFRVCEIIFADRRPFKVARGPLAQLVERRIRIAEISGSIPLRSTRLDKENLAHTKVRSYPNPLKLE